MLGAGKFFSEQINPLLDGLAANGPDAGCAVNALEALLQAGQRQYDGQAWVYTDGDAAPGNSVGYVQQQLNNQLVRGSVVLLGGCNSAPKVQSNVTGQEKNYLGLAADGSQPGGIVPYLLTAIGTGGQFLYVAPDQLANAVDILRAQASHSAGAGRWSDYVSNRFTYRWDRLNADEYQWMPSGLLQDRGQLSFRLADAPDLAPAIQFLRRADQHGRCLRGRLCAHEPVSGQSGLLFALQPTCQHSGQRSGLDLHRSGSGRGAGANAGADR